MLTATHGSAFGGGVRGRSSTPAAPVQAGIRTVRVALVAGCVALLYFISDHDLLISLYEDFSTTSEFMEAVAAEGNWTRQLALLTLGAIGLIGLSLRNGYRLHLRGGLSLLMFATASWCAASWLWSIEPSISARRLVSIGLMALAALSAARLLRPRELAATALACFVFFLGIGVVTEAALGSFQPWRGDYRFAGTVHPNHQGLNSAIGVLAAVALAGKGTPRRAALWGLAAAGLAALWMTRSRTSLAALLLAALILWLLTTSWRNRIAWGAGAAGLASLTMLVSGGQFLNHVLQAALLGRTDEHFGGALTGRVPLWEELSESIARRPWTGYGFNSFWIPRNIEDISQSQSWAISTAHSAYVDLTLGVGLIGAGLCVGVAVWGLIRVVRLHKAAPSLGFGFIASLLLFVMVHGLLESTFANPGFFSLLALSGLAMLAMVDPQEYTDRR